MWQPEVRADVQIGIESRHTDEHEQRLKPPDPARSEHMRSRKERADHAGADHEFERDASRPEWHGWHAFRRGLGTNLAELGVDDLTIQRILLHANVQVTRQHYIKVRDARVEAAMKLLETALALIVRQLQRPRCLPW